MLYFEKILNSEKNGISDIEFFIKNKSCAIKVFPDVLESILRKEMFPLLEVLDYCFVIDKEHFETNKLCIELINNNKSELFLQKISKLSDIVDYDLSIEDLSLTSWFLGVPLKMEY